MLAPEAYDSSKTVARNKRHLLVLNNASRSRQTMIVSHLDCSYMPAKANLLI
jgi:hypothetical protein